MFLFSQPPPLRMRRTSISGCSHCSKWKTGVPGPRLSPLLRPVMESTELGRSLPRRVASAMASQAAWRTSIWLTPTGVWMKKVGMPVSWQMGASSSAAMSMLPAMMASACAACVPGVSAGAASDMAARTSGGRLVEVSVIRSRRLLLRNCMAIPWYPTRGWEFDILPCCGGSHGGVPAGRRHRRLLREVPAADEPLDRVLDGHATGKDALPHVLPRARLPQRRAPAEKRDKEGGAVQAGACHGRSERGRGGDRGGAEEAEGA